MAPPTKDDDETAPGQAAADRVRERHQRAIDRYDLETERALDAYEAGDDRESITLVNNITIEDVRRAQESRKPPHSMPARNTGELVVKAGNKALKSIDKAPPKLQPFIWIGIAVALVAAWRLGWLAP